MGFHLLSRGCQLQHCAQRLTTFSGSLRFLHLVSRLQQTIGIAFDIDGVLLRGKTPIEGASAALKQLHGTGPGDQDGKTKAGQALIPHVYLTNGGGVTEAAKAEELASLLDVPVSEEQVILGHTPFKNYVDRYRDQRVLSVGKGDTKKVMEAYGFRHVVPMEEYVHEFPDIDPLAPYGPSARQTEARNPPDLPPEHRIAAVFVVSDPVNWGRDIQVLCDVLRSGGFPGHADTPHPPQVPLFLAADDFEYQAMFPVPRFGMGAFRIALESLFNRLYHKPLSHVAYGKPSPEPYRFALEALRKQHAQLCRPADPSATVSFDRVYMVGDNPKTDVRGALNAGHPWRPILTRTGVYRGNHRVYKSPGDGPGESGPHSFETPVMSTVSEAVGFILAESQMQPR
ncbi:Haloacid dehalogenase-like hydrolase (HAD) superfamily protein [Klebsormidium nitens]|uniref:Haloacid dehalogenase-like hydrolase (HAD) superfamily protein n=1 Tax=Klebsormidium nitens TaxID=105231 RepID=A0A1Y1IH50_KLENI|nr:Haloacid dehalogenase-like hydrolase (HAD) superfamily protein [Klebsormidium nitens]|eukprot:GAQ90190.1 Haloacid dehalogenase-like hydrolase (HAD) superfamily protein [Klebsormidium nitens]